MKGGEDLKVPHTLGGREKGGGGQKGFPSSFWTAGRKGYGCSDGTGKTADWGKLKRS